MLEMIMIEAKSQRHHVPRVGGEARPALADRMTGHARSYAKNWGLDRAIDVEITWQKLVSSPSVGKRGSQVRRT